MRKVSQRVLGFLLLAVFATSAHAQATQPKRFKRALIVAGGGVAPAVGMGMVVGARQAGWEPDVVITTCGASMAAALMNAFPNTDQALAYAKSARFHDQLRTVEVKTSNLLDLKKIFDRLDRETIPDLFDGTVLTMPESLKGWIADSAFRADAAGPRYVMLAARASFGPEHVGTTATQQDLFKQVFFTDGETARYVAGFRSTIRARFPESRVALETEVITDVPADEATRASIADPLLINPARIGDAYYFTGAVDLRPIELAYQLADEVVATYPEGQFTDYEEKTMARVMGFSPRVRVLQTILDESSRDVVFIDVKGLKDVNFDPEQSFLKIVSRIPKKPEAFEKGIQAQFDFGAERAREAIEAQRSRAPGTPATRAHIRKALQPDCSNPKEAPFCANLR